MADNVQPPSYTIAPDEKVVPMMIYTNTGMARGEMITKQTIRVSTWFRSAGVYDFLHLHRAQYLVISGASSIQAHSLPDLFISSYQIIAAHIIPPGQEPLDYDASEPNRKMEAVSVYFSLFRCNAAIRMSASSNLGQYLSTAKEVFLTLYDSEITCPAVPNMGTVRSPMLLLRPSASTFSLRH